MKRHITGPKVIFGKEVMFTSHYGSFRGHLETQNSNLMSAIDSASQNLEKDIWHAPKGDLAKKFRF